MEGAMPEADERWDRWVLPDTRSALEWCRERNAGQIRGVLDLLGQYAHGPAEAVRSTRAYVALVKAIERSTIKASLAVKLTTLGAVFDRELCRRNLISLSGAGARRGIGVEIEMEGKSLADFTLHSAIECAGEGFNITVALQAYLDRTPADLERALQKGLRVRLVKGAYLGDASGYNEVQRRLKELATRASESGLPFSIGTHDPEMLEWARTLPVEKGRLEFGFLKGLSDRTKLSLAHQGWPVAEYVPFGRESEAYVQRRLNHLRMLEKLGKGPAP